MSLFDEDGNPINTPDQDPVGGKPAAQAGSPVETLLSAIKNENGEQKYASVEEALKGLTHSQQFIEQLKNETAEMRGKLKTQDELAEMLKPKSPDPIVEADKSKAQPTGITAEDVEAILEQREVAKAATANLEKVKTVLQSKFGAEYKQKLKDLTSSLGLEPELVDSIARKSPDALFRTLGIPLDTPIKATVSGANTNSFTGEKPEPKRFNPRETGVSKDVLLWRDVEKRVNAKYDN